MKKITFALIITLFSFSAFSAISDSDKLNVFEMKRKIQAQGKIIQDLNREMGNVEQNLGTQNKKYLKLADERSKLEELLSVARKNADLDNLSLKKSYNETKNILMGVLLNKLEKNESSADLLSRKILIGNLQIRLSELDGMMKGNKTLQDDVERLYQRLEDSMKTEKELLALMGELEQRKKEIHATIETENQKKNEDLNTFEEAKNKMAMQRESARKKEIKEKLLPVQITEEIKIPSQLASVSGADFMPPIVDSLGIDYQKKGVTFNFQGKNEVHAPKGGKVVYTGSLASYGNVLMIDHGNDTRTVLLGQFDSTVKNGDQVRSTQIIGYTNPKSNRGLGDGKIYFEVRKNNLAQNTYLLLDKKLLAKNISK